MQKDKATPFDEAMVRQMLEQGANWRAIGEALGVSVDYARNTAARRGIRMTAAQRHAAKAEAATRSRQAKRAKQDQPAALPAAPTGPGKTLARIEARADSGHEERAHRAAMAKFSATLLRALITAVRNGAKGAPLPLVHMAHEQIRQAWKR